MPTGTPIERVGRWRQRMDASDYLCVTAKFAASGFGLSRPLRFTRFMLNLRKVSAIDIALLGYKF